MRPKPSNSRPTQPPPASRLSPAPSLRARDAAHAALSLSVAERYVDAFAALAREGTAVIVPGNVGDMGAMIASAMSVYGRVGDAQAKAAAARSALENGGVVTSQPRGGDAVAAELDTGDAAAVTDKAQTVRDRITEDFERATKRR